MKPITAPIEWTYMHPGDAIKCAGPKSRLLRFAKELEPDYAFDLTPENGAFMVTCTKSPKLVMQWEKPRQ
jgi:hypothetical protein